MTTALAVSTPRLTPDVFQMISYVAPTIHTARLFGTASPEQAAAIMIKGFELGFSLTASFENIHVIDNKPSLSPKGALALIYSSPECAGVKITDEVDDKGAPVACSVWMKRRNGLEYTARFSMEDARRAGVVKEKSGWSSYPSNMLRWRAIGYCADIVFPDVIGGTKRADEFGAEITPDGDVVEGSWSVQGSQPTAQPAAATVSQQQPVMTLNDLTSRYSPDEILAVNDNKIPATNEDIERVAAALANRDVEITGGK